MDAIEAKASALDLLRRRLAKGWHRDDIEHTTFEGASGPSLPGYLMSGGKISVPHPPGFRHGAGGTHAFSLRALLDEIERGVSVPVQAGLFA